MSDLTDKLLNATEEIIRLRKLRDSIRSETIEECAKIADGYGAKWGNGSSQYACLEIADQLRALDKPADDGWIEWKTPSCPVTFSTVVEVKLSGGSVMPARPAANWNWDRSSSSIVAYRVTKSPHIVECQCPQYLAMRGDKQSWRKMPLTAGMLYEVLSDVNRPIGITLEALIERAARKAVGE